ncbi:hypothetical protein BAE44_0026403 [Dichanthelium oligosanthes]|uniref:Uncharacterized protein n=1 Tax=Dichanthelium oligosanthes TaxID=888268 RepID=A0A1E5UID1_9POAL|nr:hypothetical protein BAE44_0026403 [Dichanthelium oligosanthes]
MAAHLTVRDMLYFYCDTRNVYERFVNIGSHPEQARNAVALLLWLDPAHHQAIRHLPSLTPASSALSPLRPTPSSNASARQQSLVLPPIPFISALCQEGGIEVDAAFLAFNQDLVVRSVTDILDYAGALIFDDHLYRLLRRYQTGLVGRLPKLEASYSCHPCRRTAAPCSSPSPRASSPASTKRYLTTSGSSSFVPKGYYMYLSTSDSSTYTYIRVHK